MDAKKILWIGPLVRQEDVVKYLAVSPAANVWQKDFISAILDKKQDITVMTYIPEPSFPKGRLFIKKSNKNPINCNTFNLGYINIFKLRDYILYRKMRKKVKKSVRFDVVVTYNNTPAHMHIGKYLRDKYNVLWVSIVADAAYPVGADAYVFLSYTYYQKAMVRNKIHLDGGVGHSIKDENNDYFYAKNKVILYSGGLTKWTGIETFAQEFSEINLSGIQLKIFGKGTSKILIELSKLNKNIILGGFVSDECLLRERKNALIFVNPRPVGMLDGEKNFPSKILEYLQYCKPILSTVCEGLAPYYQEFLYFYDSNSADSLKKCLIKLMNLSEIDIKIMRAKINIFCDNHSWDRQADRFLQFIENVE